MVNAPLSRNSRWTRRAPISLDNQQQHSRFRCKTRRQSTQPRSLRLNLRGITTIHYSATTSHKTRTTQAAGCYTVTACFRRHTTVPYASHVPPENMKLRVCHMFKLRNIVYIIHTSMYACILSLWRQCFSVTMSIRSAKCFVLVSRGVACACNTCDAVGETTLHSFDVYTRAFSMSNVNGSSWLNSSPFDRDTCLRDNFLLLNVTVLL